MNENHLLATLIVGVLLTLITIVGINVGTGHSCKLRAIDAGYAAAEVQELCK